MTSGRQFVNNEMARAVLVDDEIKCVYSLRRGMRVEWDSMGKDSSRHLVKYESLKKPIHLN